MLFGRAGLSEEFQFSGHIAAYLRPRAKDQSQVDWLEIITEGSSPILGRAVRIGAEFALGDHIVISQLFPASAEDGFVKVPLSFRGVRTVEELLHILDLATKESVTCEFSIAAKRVRQFESMKERCRKLSSEFRETAEGNFRAKISLGNVSLEVDAFRSTGDLSLRGTYNKYVGDIRRALNSLLSARSLPS